MTRKLFTILFLLLAMAVQAQRQQISYIEETKNWYYVYDEQGKRIGGLSRSSVGELKTMNVSDVGEIVGVSNSTITSRKGSWIFTWNKEGKKISARSAQ